MTEKADKYKGYGFWDYGPIMWGEILLTGERLAYPKP
jgi:hypothetical protein